MVPSFPGADAVYSKAYRLLARMGTHGHVMVTKRGRKVVRVTPSAEMDDLIEALNQGDEERIKGLLMQYEDRKLAG